MKYIAITQRVQVLSEIGERRDALSQEWTALAAQCGFLPILLPNTLSMVQALFDHLPIDGILFSGGNDLLTHGGDAPERDAVEHFLIEYAIQNKITLLGICRGMEIILEHFGTELVPIDGHIRVHHPLTTGEIVNSFHSFGAHSCKAPLKATHMSEDGVVEGIIHHDYPWIHGIMWHPERYHPFRQKDILWIKEMFHL